MGRRCITKSANCELRQKVGSNHCSAVTNCVGQQREHSCPGPPRLGSRPEICHRCLGRQQQSGSPFPPHPNPLPWGEGDPIGRLASCHARTCNWRIGLRFSLSPRERVGVRGKGALAPLWPVTTCQARPRQGSSSQWHWTSISPTGGLAEKGGRRCPPS